MKKKIAFLSALMIALCLPLFPVAEAKEPEWSYDTDFDVQEVAISPDGEHIAARRGPILYLFDRSGSEPLWSYESDNHLNTIAISGDGSYIAAGGSNKKLYLFDRAFTDSAPLWTYTAPRAFYSVAISEDGQYIAAGTGDEDDTVYLFQRDDSDPLWSYQVSTAFSHGVRAISISSDGSYIAAGSDNGNVYFFERTDSNPQWNYSTGTVRKVPMSADGSYIAVGSGSKKAFLFDREGAKLWEFDAAHDVGAIDISADGEYIVAAATGTSAGDLYLLQRNGSLLWRYVKAYYTSVSISSNGSYIAVGSDHSVLFFHKDENTTIWSYEADNTMRTVSLSAKGNYIAAGSQDDYVYLFFHNLSPKAESLEFSCSQVYRTQSIIIYANGSDAETERDALTCYLRYRPPSGDWSDLSVGFSTDHWETTFTPNVSAEPGQYDFRFKLSDEQGGESSWLEISDGVTVLNNPPMAAIGSITPKPALEGEVVSFDGTASDIDGAIAEYNWTSSLNEGIGTTASFTISTLSVGTHTITFRVRDNDGAWSSPATTTLTINANPLVPSLQASPAKVKVGERVTLNGSNSTGNIAAYFFDFGDGTNSEWVIDAVITHAYSKDGIYTAKLKVKDGEGTESAYTTVEITVEKKKDDDGGGFIPGFEVPMLLAALFLLVWLRRLR